MKVLETSSEALINNIKAENAKLISIVEAKSTEIGRLLNELNTLRGQQAADAAEHSRMSEELKERMRHMERDWFEEEERLKIKFAELR